MKKRILSVVISAVMILTSFTAVFAATEYDGIKPLQTEEKVLDQLNADAAADIFDKAQHAAQYDALAAVNTAFDTNADTSDAWDDYVTAVYTNRKTDYITGYMKLLKLIAGGNTAAQTALNDVDAQYPTATLGLKASFDKLDGYQEAVAEVINDHKHNFVDLTEAEVEDYVREASEPVFRVILSSIGTGSDSTAMAKNYESWMASDRAKKLLAILYGEELTKELATDSEGEGVVSQVKSYMATSEGMSYISSQLSNIFVVDEAAFAEAVYDFIGNVLYKAYAGEEVQEDIQMLFGGNGVTGAFEHGMKALDPECKAANVLLNLFLSEYVQAQIAGQNLTTITSVTTIGSQAETDARVRIEDNSTIAYIPENIFAEYDISDSGIMNRLSYRTSWFKMVCYAEDSQNPGSYIDNSEYVTCSGSSFNVEKKDENKGDTYPAYLVLYLYRKDADNENDTFIESYPITVVNAVKSTGGGGGTTRYTLTYETNGGTAITSERYAKGKTVELSKVPVKDGYTFAGWYLDKELTKRVDAVVMSNSVTVYAAWTELQGVDVPEMLNGEDHYAYVIGYPDGTVRPQNNITRAEAATIIFRLLNDDVRTANITAENGFVDSNDGDWYNTAVSTLAALKIVNGRTETEFAPNEFITRAEFAAIFARFAQFDVADAELSFTDINSHWAKDEILETAGYGWIKGYEDNSFRPDQRITRAEAMTLINRVLKRIPENAQDLHADMVKWSDNSETAWYYIAVQEATNSHEYEMKNSVNEKWTNITENRDWTTFEK